MPKRHSRRKFLQKAGCAIAAGACVCATGAGFFNTRMIATSEATSVRMLIMRSSLSFFILTLCYRAEGTDIR